MGLIKWITKLIEKHKQKKLFKEKMGELKKRDPFVYNH